MTEHEGRIQIAGQRSRRQPTAAQLERENAALGWELEYRKLADLYVPLRNAMTTLARTVMAVPVGTYTATRKDADGSCVLDVMDGDTVVMSLAIPVTPEPAKPVAG